MVFEVAQANKTPKVDDVDHDQQRTFALVFPFALVHEVVGKIVMAFEKKNLQVEDMQLMGVRHNFAMKHISRTGRTPSTHALNPSFDWVNALASGPVVVMILRGNDAVNKAREVVSDDIRVPFWNGGLANLYCSDSVQSARDDIDLWFTDDYYSGGHDLYNKNDLYHTFVDGKCYGAKDIFDGSEMELRPYGIDPYLTDNNFWNRHVFALISSIAIKNYKVGGIIHGLELNSFSIRGMKLVKKEAKFFQSKVWAEIEENEFGIVVLMDKLERHNIKELDELDGLVHVDDSVSEVVQIKRNLIYLSDDGAPAWKLAGEFFPYGSVCWVEQRYESVEFCGGYFDATLIGLIE